VTLAPIARSSDFARIGAAAATTALAALAGRGPVVAPAPRMSNRLITTALLAASLLFAACGSKEPPKSTTTTRTQTTTSDNTGEATKTDVQVVETKQVDGSKTTSTTENTQHTTPAPAAH
jgi:hypothetical protein